MAGGLVGAILGGGLGAGARQSMMSESPAARHVSQTTNNKETLSHRKSQC